MLMTTATTHKANAMAYGIPAPQGYVTVGYAASIIKAHGHEAYHTADGLMAICWERDGIAHGPAVADNDDWYEVQHVFDTVDHDGQTGRPMSVFVSRAAVMAWLGY